MSRGRPKKEVIKDPNAPVMTPDEAVAAFLKEVVTVSQQIQVLREHLADFKKYFDENDLVDKDTQKMLLKALKLFEGEVDMDHLEELYETVKETIMSGFKTTKGETE